MKRTIFMIMVFFVCVILVSAEKTDVQKSPSEVIVGSGCVGQCEGSVGTSATIEYTVESGSKKVLMIVKAAEVGLCRNTGVYAFLFKNGKEVANGRLANKDDSIQTKAEPGDKIVAYCTTYPLFNGIVCVRGGELKFDLIMKNTGKKRNCLP